jgi:hypothetical protein
MNLLALKVILAHLLRIPISPKEALMWTAQKEGHIFHDKFSATREKDEHRFKKVAIAALLLLLAIISAWALQWMNYIDLTLH